VKLVIASQKGGVGKTTIALNLAVAFARLGYRTALVDTDPQGALNLCLAKGNMEFPGLVEVLRNKENLDKVLIKSKLAQLSLLTKGRLAIKAIPQYEKLIFGGDGLDDLARQLRQTHDLVIFDTPAGMGMITRAVLRVGSHVLVPFKVDSLNLRSINQILQVLDVVQKEENPGLTYLGMVLNMFEKAEDLSFRIAGEVWQSFPSVLDTTIPRADIFARALELGAPLALIGRREHPEARRFTALANEIISLADPQEEKDEEVRQLI